MKFFLGKNGYNLQLSEKKKCTIWIFLKFSLVDNNRQRSFSRDPKNCLWREIAFNGKSSLAPPPPPKARI